MKPKSRLRLLPLLAVGPLLLQAVPVQAQCVFGMAGNTTTGGGLKTAYKSVTNASRCELTGFNNVLRCVPGGQPPVIGVTRPSGPLTATATGAAVNPSCKWKCDCPGGFTTTVTISGPDGGLPVELMDFEVEDGTDAEAPNEGDDAAAGE